MTRLTKTVRISVAGRISPKQERREVGVHSEKCTEMSLLAVEYVAR